MTRAGSHFHNPSPDLVFDSSAQIHKCLTGPDLTASRVIVLHSKGMKDAAREAEA
jgi:hypothetical protein